MSPETAAHFRDATVLHNPIQEYPSMPASSFVDFKAVKAAVTMEQLLKHYDLLDTFKRKGRDLSGPCPIHKGTNPTQFRVSLDKNIWNCFSECKHGGNALDFVAEMEKVSVHAAANKIIEWFKLNRDELRSGSTEEPELAERSEARPASSPKPRAEKAPAPADTTPNPPLKFRLEKLEREHPYLKERGLTLETIVDFGIGFCAKGLMAGRIAIPIHNATGDVVAYAGRFIGPSDENTPKYKLPQGFRKSLELFNLDRAIKEPGEKPLVIVEGFFGCMTLHQHGHKKVVALMGSTMSEAQEELIRKYTTTHSQIIVALDGDDAGRAGGEDIALRLSRFCFVRRHEFETEGMQPEQLMCAPSSRFRRVS
jgi:DNA primase